MKTCIIAEKPSVAREIAAIAGASKKEEGFFTGNNYMVTWAIGHLIQLAMPEDYGFQGFIKENLPIIPETFILKPRQVREGKQYKPDSGALRQLKVIKHLFDRCDKIIVATDAGREGELIFRHIYSYLNCQKPFDRLWISSLTDKAIKDGLQNLKPGSDYDKLYFAAKARSEADWFPRTGSRYISADVFDEIPELINNLKTHPRFGAYAQSMDNAVLNIRCVDDKKITDHHALLITENMPKGISGEEQTIYEMIAGRMLEAFSKKSVKDATTIILNCGDKLFEARGSTVKQAGWRSVFCETEEQGEDEAGNLPEVTKGETLPVLHSEILEKQTKPKPLHTEATLLGAMEAAGKEIENQTEREAMKESGIGTPATRAAIIETLFARDYIRREKKSLLPTEKGLTVYETVKDKRIADIEMTGAWENALAQIERSDMIPETFRRAIEIYI